MGQIGALSRRRARSLSLALTLPLTPKPLNGRAVKRVRAAFHASQAVFASYLNVSTKLVQAWEANRRTPDGPALVLLHIAARQPVVLERMREVPRRPRRHRATQPRAGRHAAAAR